MSDMTQYNSVSARISKKERVTHPALRLVISTAVILGLWQLVVVVFDMPSFILPSPIEVLDRLVTRYDVLSNILGLPRKRFYLAWRLDYQWVCCSHCKC